MGPMMRLMEPLFGHKNAQTFFERAQQGAIHSYYETNREDWIPPLLGENAEPDVKVKKKKRTFVPQNNSLNNYFSCKKKK